MIKVISEFTEHGPKVTVQCDTVEEYIEYCNFKDVQHESEYIDPEQEKN